MQIQKTKQGYKQTPIGEIPEEWIVKSVGELLHERAILEIQDGNHGELHPKQTDFLRTDSGIPFVTANCIIDNKIVLDRCQLLKEEWHNKLRIGFAKGNDVILTHKGSLGLCAVVPRDIGTMILSPQTTYYRLSNKLLPKFLYYVFQSYFFQKQLSQLGKQSTRDYVGITTQRKLLLPFIATDEQLKIATILSKVDELILKTDQVIEQTQRLKKGLMQRLLTKGIGHTRYKNTVVGEIPEDWYVDSLGRFVRIISGEYFAYNEFVNTGIRVLKIDNVMYGKIDWENQTYLPSDYLQSHDELVLKEGDLVLALNRPITNGELKVARLTQHDVPSILYQRVGKIAFNEDITIDHDFLHTFLSGVSFKKIINRILIGSDQPYIKTTELLRQRVGIPSDLNEQQKIAKIMFDTNKLINMMLDERRRLRIVKKGLMQKLLAGKIRVKV